MLGGPTEGSRAAASGLGDKYPPTPFPSLYIGHPVLSGTAATLAAGEVGLHTLALRAAFLGHQPTAAY